MKNKIKCVIVDDIPEAIEAVRIQCDRHNDLQIVKEYEDSDLFLSEADKIDFDVCFLDIKMPNIRGTEVARKLKNKEIIFITGEKQEAVEAFNLNVVDFIVKPLFRSRFDEAISKLRQKIEQNIYKSFYIQNKPLENEYVFFNTDKGKVKIKLSHIRYIRTVKEHEGDPRDKVMILEDLESFLLKNITLHKLQQDYLPNSMWLQVNRREIIHFNAIYSIPSIDLVQLNIEENKKKIECTISDSYRDLFYEKLKLLTKK